MTVYVVCPKSKCTDFLYTYIYIYVYPIFEGSSGTASFFPSFGFPVNHDFWESRWVHSFDMTIPNELFSGYFIQYRIWFVHYFSSHLKPTGYVMHHQFNIQQLYALPTLYLCVLYLSENKQRLVPLTP